MSARDSISIVSDIHIQSPRDPAYLALIDLMAERLPDGSTFVLAGDVFDFLMGGPPRFYDQYSAFFDAFADLRKRDIKVHYIEGNHDFHLKSFLDPHPNVIRHSDSVDLVIAGKKFHIAHGDLIDREDFGYRFLRLILRSPVIALGAKVIPEKIVFKIGDRLSVATKALRSSWDPRIERSRKLFRNYAVVKFQSGFDFVVLGHSHDYDAETIVLGERTCYYMNVGFPKSHKTYVYWDPEESKLVRRSYYS